MKWYYKVGCIVTMVGVIAFGGVECYDRYFVKVNDKVVVQKDKKSDIEAFGVEQPSEKIVTNKESEQKEEAGKEKLEVKEKATKFGKSTSRGKSGKQVYSAYGKGPTITVLEGDGDTYLTNKKNGVLVRVDYEGSGDKTIQVTGSAQKVVSKNAPYQYIFKVADNVDITAKSGSNTTTKTINNFVTVTTGCEVLSGTGYVKDKTYYQAVLGGKITGTVAMSEANIKELGVRYWRGDVEDEIYTVKTQTIKNQSSSKASGQMVSIGTNSITYELLARSLKENTTYYMQAYMINKSEEVLLGDVKEFSTLGHGIGLYGLYYNNTSDIAPKLIKQETSDKMTISVPEGYNKVKWEGEIAPLNSGLMKFRVTGPSSASIKINDETLSFTSSGQEKKTSKIYSIGEKYPIVIETKGVSKSTVKIEWMEDGGYQEIHKEQLYPREYVKITSAVINSKGTDNQEVNKTTGEVIKKKVITNGQNIKTFSLTYNTDNVATGATVRVNDNNETYTLTGSSATGELVGWLVYNTNNVIEPLDQNVSTIDYGTNKVTLRNGSVWTLYQDVEVVGRLMRLSDRKVYDLGRYISSTNTLTDGKSLSSSDLYRADNVDNTYIVNLYDRESNPSYQQALEQYSTMERFVEDAKSVDKWNLAIGEGRLYSIIPIRILLSFDGDNSFDMKNPVIQIKKDLFKTKDCSSKDTVFKLSLPTDAVTKNDAGDKTITSLYYGDWRYMGKVTGSYNREATSAPSKANVTIREPYGKDYFEVILNDYVTPNTSITDTVGLNNIMINLLLRVDSINQKTSKEVFDGVSDSEKERTGYNLNASYRTYTKARVDSLNSSGIATDITEIPIEIKIKPQVTFE